jgi:CubicO group peptidase (beta-lactamase class C family)
MIDAGWLDAVLHAATGAANPGARVPGVVAMAADRDGIVYQGAAGRRRLDADAPMTLDTVFMIASMTKAVTATAAMQLVEQGRLSLDGPLHAHAPYLAEVPVLAGFEADGTPRLRPREGDITLRHLLTHTAGFVYDTWNADMARFASATGLLSPRTGKRASLEAPLAFDPGARWEYGINIDWAGRVVEAVSGQDLESYFRDHIFAPLGMRDTAYLLPADRDPRRASVHAREADGGLRPTDARPNPAPEFFPGGGGLSSTAPDYMRFLRALMAGGTLDGATILRPETVALMARNHIGDLDVGGMRSFVPASSNDVEFFPGMKKKWGLSFLINTEDAPGGGRSAGSLAWAGLMNTYYWLDPKRQVCGVVMTQVLPFGDHAVLDTLTAFERAVYAAL